MALGNLHRLWIPTEDKKAVASWGTSLGIIYDWSFLLLSAIIYALITKKKYCHFLLNFYY